MKAHPKSSDEPAPGGPVEDFGGLLLLVLGARVPADQKLDGREGEEGVEEPARHVPEALPDAQLFVAPRASRRTPPLRSARAHSRRSPRRSRRGSRCPTTRRRAPAAPPSGRSPSRRSRARAERRGSRSGSRGIRPRPCPGGRATRATTACRSSRCGRGQLSPSLSDLLRSPGEDYPSCSQLKPVRT